MPISSARRAPLICTSIRRSRPSTAPTCMPGEDIVRYVSSRNSSKSGSGACVCASAYFSISSGTMFGMRTSEDGRRETRILGFRALRGSAEKPLRVDDGAVVPAAADLAGGIVRDDLERIRLFVAPRVARDGAHAGAGRGRRRVDEVDERSDGELSGTEKGPKHARGRKLHERDHARSREDVRKASRVPVREAAREVRLLDDPARLALCSNGDLRHGSAHREVIAHAREQDDDGSTATEPGRPAPLSLSKQP